MKKQDQPLLRLAIGNVVTRRVGDGKQTRVAERGGLSESEVSLIAHGERLPRFDKQKALARGLGWTYLQFWDELVRELQALLDAQRRGELRERGTRHGTESNTSEEPFPADPPTSIEARLTLPVEELSSAVARRVIAELDRRSADRGRG